MQNKQSKSVIADVNVGQTTISGTISPAIQIRVYEVEASQQSASQDDFAIAFNTYALDHLGIRSPLEDLMRAVCRLDERYLTQHGFFSTHAREYHFTAEVLVTARDGVIQYFNPSLRNAGERIFKQVFPYPPHW